MSGVLWGDTAFSAIGAINAFSMMSMCMGAAIATVLSETLAAIACILYAFAKVPQFRQAFQHRAINKNLIWKTLQVGVPTGLQYALIYVSSIILQRIVNGFGESVIGAFTATTQIELLVQQIFAALGAAIVTYTGQNMGADKHDRISLGVVAAMKISAAVSVVLLVVFWLFGQPIMSIFVTNSEIIDGILLEYERAPAYPPGCAMPPPFGCSAIF